MWDFFDGGGVSYSFIAERFEDFEAGDGGVSLPCPPLRSREAEDARCGFSLSTLRRSVALCLSPFLSFTNDVLFFCLPSIYTFTGFFFEILVGVILFGLDFFCLVCGSFDNFLELFAFAHPIDFALERLFLQTRLLSPDVVFWPDFDLAMMLVLRLEIGDVVVEISVQSRSIRRINGCFKPSPANCTHGCVVHVLSVSLTSMRI